MGCYVLGRDELAVLAVALSASGGAEPFAICQRVADLHYGNVLAFVHSYARRHDTSDVNPISAFEIMREMGQLLGIRDEPIGNGIMGQYKWEWHDKHDVFEQSWRLTADPDVVRQARQAAWLLIYNATANDGTVYMGEHERRIALDVAHALLCIDHR
jgi:hypothetical protein